MHIYSIKARPIKNGTHLDLTVNTLLAQYGNTRLCIYIYIRGRNIIIQVEGQRDRNARIFSIENLIILFSGADRIITNTLHVVAGRRPLALQLYPTLYIQLLLA